MSPRIPPPTINILIVDDHPLYLKGLRLLLDQDPRIAVVGTAGSGVEAIELISLLRPDVVFMDLVLPGLNGIDTTRRITQLFSDVHTIILTGTAGVEHVALALQAGARGYLIKNGDAATIFEAVRVIMMGEIYIAPGIVPASRDRTVSDAADSASRIALQVQALLDYIVFPEADHLWTKNAPPPDNGALRVIRSLGNRRGMRNQPGAIPFGKRRLLFHH